MAGNMRHKNILSLQTVKPQSINFGLMSSSEILELSVTKIVTPITFDQLGLPVRGGLYDPMLGPIDKGSPCTTCYSNIYDCPGHMGHIDLPLPVINPLFHNVIAEIMKISCNKCHSILLPFSTKCLLINQLKLLCKGYMKEAMELELVANHYRDGTENTGVGLDALLLNKLNKHVNKILKRHCENINKTVIDRPIRSTQQLRDNFINEAFRDSQKQKLCPNCKEAFQKVKVIQKKLIMNVRVEVANKYGEQDERTTAFEGGQTFIMPSETLVHLRKVWAADASTLEELIPILKTAKIEYPTDLFFFVVLPVTPACLRPVNFVNGNMSEHLQNKVYKAILDDCLVVKSIIHLMKGQESGQLSSQYKELVAKVRGSTFPEKLQFAWQSLQSNCDFLVEENKMTGGSLDGVDLQGLKQIIEKKEGIIRKNMMGKRVNFAARSVITPDPNLNIDEIGIPEEFAKKLTYPVPVTSWNVKELRKLVMNGPDIHPGAVLIEAGDGFRTRILANNPVQRESLANTLLTQANSKTKGVKIVHRHLTNGDVLLLNRQPTLHKPSIMAHRARVLKNEKTLRLHYSNCKSYNADFDGDEMNAHFPQNELARSEAYNIANVTKQYLVPKDGTPLGGLIQDHMVSGVRLSVRGRFFNCADYKQLVFQALPYVRGDLKLLPPAILKPVRLWSGKQIISTVILNIIPKGKVPINLESTAKISFKAWEKSKPRAWIAGGTPLKSPITMTEAEVVIRSGELLCGVLDKTHYGATPYSLIHCMYELYGGTCSSNLLSSFGKLFMAFLQIEGFTLGVKDILVKEKADRQRTEHIKTVQTIGIEAATQALQLPLGTDPDELKRRLEEAYKKDSKFRAIIDRQYKTCLDSCTNKVNSACMPDGLIEPFPKNNLQLMVQSGAKGSTVNTMQISCLLGQIELEGKRPPLMVSGRSLPSFPPYEISARAGGFVEGRFMTGIQPQEFFFHCMAGREGLIDTAVKTSRSGYLQRCLVKHLEGICVNYDMTVRDSDGCIIQYLYGEDGMDVTRAQFFKDQQMPILIENSRAILNVDAVNRLKSETELNTIKKHCKETEQWLKFMEKNGYSLTGSRISPFMMYCLKKGADASSQSDGEKAKDNGRSVKDLSMCSSWSEEDSKAKAKYIKRCKKRPDPLTSVLQADRNFGVLSEKLDSLINNYLENNRLHGINMNKEEVNAVISQWSMQSMCAPGEPVGILAAQSIGEPSTQMTLNTFHFAGRGEMNVTLGIPRLREILMVASKVIKTPSIEVPFNMDIEKVEKVADKLRKKLTRVTLAELLEYVSVSERQVLEEPNRRQLYDFHFKILPHHCYKEKTHIKPVHVLRHIEKTFIKELIALERKKRSARKQSEYVSSANSKKKPSRTNNEDEEFDGAGEAGADDLATMGNVDADSSDDDGEADADGDDATTANRRARRQEEQEYEEPEDDDDVRSDGEDDGDTLKEDTNERIGEDDDERAKEVVEMNQCVENYRYDSENELWCEVTICFPHSVGRIDFASVLREKASASVIYEVPGIKRAFTYKANNKIMLKTDGSSFSQMFRYAPFLDLNKLYSNDIHGIARTYGIEAAARVIVKEVQDVFKVYGIVVDPRHLLLIADYMTFDGTIQPLNRIGMYGGLSPLQQMSFEASTRFLKTAVLQNKSDLLQSPSSRLVIGQPCRSGTGIVDVRMSTSAFLAN